MKYYITTLFLLVLGMHNIGFSQSLSQSYWQQKVEYDMEIIMDTENHQFEGKQRLIYHNNSGDTLSKIYYHLYFNAFQPGSMMDERSLTIQDPDRRVGSRIAGLKDDEIGYHHIKSLKQNGKDVSYKVTGTILEVRLNEPLLPNSKTTMSMDFNSQVPLQIRRTGRDNAEGISYSMSQWYPKLAEYDYLGWHTDPYIGREFHGVWGDFDVKITIDPEYTLAGTGYLQDPDKIGHGYEKSGAKVKPETKPVTWHFLAPNVHDFMWAADPDYVHTTIQVPDGPVMHFFYQENETFRSSWEKLPEMMVKAMLFMNDNFGKYPYKQYSFIQGGDGGMEYPMSTLITGNRNFNSLLGVSVHEMIHSWYQSLLATNESLFAWMDEGFTTYASDITMQYLLTPESTTDPHAGSYANYFSMALSGNEEPLTTHADHYQSNRAYGINAYSKGAVFLHQLNYVVGNEKFMQGMKWYFNEWKFRHPTSVDFIRVMEKTSGLQLDWYLEHFVYSTNQIDYGIRSVISKGASTFVTLERLKEMMMPIDLYVKYTDGTEEIIYIPLRMMMGEKQVEISSIKRTSKTPWPWTYPTYTLKIDRSAEDIASITIDATGRMADIDRTNNSIDLSGELKEFQDPTK